MARKTTPAPAPAPKPVTMYDVWRVRKYTLLALNERLESSKASAASWAKDCTDPAKVFQALEWAHSVAPHAATIKVLGRILLWQEKAMSDAGCHSPDAWVESDAFDKWLRDVHSMALKETLRAARHPTMSTSPSANMMEMASGTEWAITHESLSYAIATTDEMLAKIAANSVR